MGGFFVPKQGAELWAYIIGAFVVGLGILYALSLTPKSLRKTLIAGITFLGGLFFALEFFWPVDTAGPMAGKNFLTAYIKPVSSVTTILGALALGLGLYSMVSIHGRAVAKRRENWGFSAVLLGAILAMAIPAIWKEYDKSPQIAGFYRIMYDGGFNPLNATMFSIVAFYIVSAAYRAFRIRTVEAGILLMSAVIIMIGQVTLGQLLTAWIPNENFSSNFRVENLSNWILTRVNSPAQLAISLGIGVGTLATALRLWLSLERGAFFDEEL